VDFKHYLKNISTFSTTELLNDFFHFQPFTSQHEKFFVPVSTFRRKVFVSGTFFSGENVPLQSES